MTAEFESGVFNRTEAWHRMGETWQPTDEEPVLTPEIAIIKGDLHEWDIYLEPIIRNGRETGKFWTVRRKDDKEFGVVGSRYEPIQNEEGFDYLKALIDEDGLEIETAVSLYEGKVVSILARKPESINIAGDGYDRFIGFTTRHDGLGAAKGFTCYTRLVCANTQTAVESEFKRSGRHFSIPHTRSAQLKLQSAREALQLSYKEDEEFKVALEAMATVKIADEQEYNGLLKRIVGADQIDKSKQQRAYLNRLQVAKTIHDIRVKSEDLDLIRDRKLGLYQAVTAYESHVRKYRGMSTKFQKLAVEGGELSKRAYKLLSV